MLFWCKTSLSSFQFIAEVNTFHLQPKPSAAPAMEAYLLSIKAGVYHIVTLHAMTEPFFILITCLTVLLFYIGIGRQNLILGIYLGWCSVIAALSYLGFFKDSASYPPRMLVVLLPAIIFVLYSRKKFSRYPLNNTYLIAIHVLRY